MTNGYNNDQPVTHVDQDELGRKKFAESIANILVLDSSQACLTVSLEGEWGAGKTSVINMIKGALLTKESPVIIVEYNPWLVGHAETMIQDFLMQLSAKIGSNSTSENALKVAEELLTYASLFSVLKLVPGAEPWASITEKVFSSFGKSTKKISELKKLDLLGKKTAVASAMKALKVPVVVIIDDIDRLTPGETFQILRLVKAVADFSGTTFLLAFDPKYLTGVLRENGIENTPEYINKIVQLRVPLPVISPRGMEKMTQSEFDVLGGEGLTADFHQDHERSSYIYERFVKRLLRTPRELKRMTNFLRLSLNQVKGQVCFADLLSLATIATVAPEIYEHIKSTPEAYVGRTIDDEFTPWVTDTKDYIKSFAAYKEKHLGTYDQTKKDTLVELIELIFPETGENYWEMFGGVSSDGAGRISNVKRLHTALHFSTPIGFISDTDIIDFMAGKVDREQFLEDVFIEDKVSRFFEMVHVRASQFTEDAIGYMEPIYRTVLGQAAQLKYGAQRTFGYASPYERSMWLTFEVLRRLPNPNAYLLWLCGQSDFLLMSCSVMRALLKESVESRSLETFKDLDAEVLKNLLCDQILSALKHRPAHLSSFETRLFWALRDIALEKLKQFVGELVAQRQLVRLVVLVGFNGNSPKGNYVHIDKDWFPDGLDYELVRQQAKEELAKDHSAEVMAGLTSLLHQHAVYLNESEMASDEEGAE